MKGWVLLAAFQIAVLAVLAHQYMQNDPPNGHSRQICGLLDSAEFVVTSRNVVMPDGMKPAAGSALLRDSFIRLPD